MRNIFNFIFNKTLIASIFLICLLMVSTETFAQENQTECYECVNLNCTTEETTIDIGNLELGNPESPCSCLVTVYYRLCSGLCEGDSIWEIKIDNIEMPPNCMGANCTMQEVMAAVTKTLLYRSYMYSIFTNEGHTSDPHYLYSGEPSDKVRVRIPACWQKGQIGDDWRIYPCNDGKCCIHEYEVARSNKTHDDDYPKEMNCHLYINYSATLAYSYNCNYPICDDMCDALNFGLAEPIGWFNYYTCSIISKVLDNEVSAIKVYYELETNTIIIYQYEFTDYEGSYNLEIFDLLGSNVYSNEISKIQLGKNEIRIPALSQGFYYARLTQSNNLITQLKILIY